MALKVPVQSSDHSPNSYAPSATGIETVLPPCCSWISALAHTAALQTDAASGLGFCAMPKRSFGKTCSSEKESKRSVSHACLIVRKIGSL